MSWSGVLEFFIMNNNDSTWSRQPGSRTKLCVECGENEPAPTRRICNTCRNAKEREARKKRDTAHLPCAMDGCTRPRHVTPTQTRSYCLEHYREYSRELQTKARREAGIEEKQLNPAPDDLVIPEDQKWCTGCSSVKDLEDFHRSADRKDGRQTRCKSCEHESYKRRLAEDPERVRKAARESQRRHRRRRAYGMTNEEFAEICDAQDGLCAICGGEPGKLGLCIDHDHDTGEVRGVICTWCNSGLGHFRDNPEFLRLAAAYLEAYQGPDSDPGDEPA